MTHIEIYTIKGKKYKYEITNYRVGKKIKHKKKYIGAVNPVHKKNNTSRKPKLKVRELTIEEEKFVEQNLKNSKSFIKDRTKIILFSNEGKTVKQIVQATGFYRPKIEKIIKQFNDNGLKIFERGKSTGKPRRITKDKRAKIIECFNTNPKNLGLHFNNWSQNKLSKYLKSINIIISQSHVGKIIRQDEIRYKKKRSKMYSNDKNFFKSIQE